MTTRSLSANRLIRQVGERSAALFRWRCRRCGGLGYIARRFDNGAFWRRGLLRVPASMRDLQADHAAIIATIGTHLRSSLITFLVCVCRRLIGVLRFQVGLEDLCMGLEILPTCLRTSTTAGLVQAPAGKRNPEGLHFHHLRHTFVPEKSGRITGRVTERVWLVFHYRRTDHPELVTTYRVCDCTCRACSSTDRAPGFEPVGWEFESPRARCFPESVGPV